MGAMLGARVLPMPGSPVRAAGMARPCLRMTGPGVCMACAGMGMPDPNMGVARAHVTVSGS
jgi:hypothetical protein